MGYCDNHNTVRGFLVYDGIGKSAYTGLAKIRLSDYLVHSRCVAYTSEGG